MDRDYAQLRQLLLAEHHVVEQLVELLGQERTALTERDVTAIERVTRAKTLALDAVERAGAARSAWARGAGVDAGSRAFGQFVRDAAARDEDSGLAEAWEKLDASLRTAHRENLVNGRIISRSRQSLSQLLDILRGQVDAPRLYGRGGRAGNSGDGGEIARA